MDYGDISNYRRDGNPQIFCIKGIHNSFFTSHTKEDSVQWLYSTYMVNGTLTIIKDQIVEYPNTMPNISE